LVVHPSQIEAVKKHFPFCAVTPNLRVATYDDVFPS
jgi:hypothetical protein